jgi:hypothetical protein
MPKRKGTPHIDRKTVATTPGQLVRISAHNIDFVVELAAAKGITTAKAVNELLSQARKEHIQTELETKFPELQASNPEQFRQMLEYLATRS